MQKPYCTVCKWLILTVLASAAWTCALGATTWNAANASFGAVQTAINSAADGDTVTVPAGSATWTTTLVLTKAITIQGLGAITTDANGRATACGTKIQNNVSGATPGILLSVKLVPGKNTRITGIEFPSIPAWSATTTYAVGDLTASNPGYRSLQNGNINHPPATSPAWWAPIYGKSYQINGTSDQDNSSFRVDHCVFGEPIYYSFWIDGCFGVADHCTFTESFGHIPFEIQHNGWGGHNYGDGSWADDSYFGTNKFFFIEDCTFNCTNSAVGDSLVDSLGGARFVVRHCIGTNVQINTHGTDSGQRQRGNRIIEIYNNTFQGRLQGNQWVVFRSGTGVVHDNQLMGVTTIGAYIIMQDFRMFGTFAPWGMADGTNPWDSNVTGGAFASGTATGGGSHTMTDSSKTWTVNQWAGYSLKKTSGTGGAGYISSNTATTITVADSSVYNGGTPVSFIAGDTYQIWKVNESLDQPGVGKGALVSGATPTLPAGWFNQATEPIYQWNNASPDGSTTVAYSGYSGNMRLNEHCFNNAKSGYTPFTYPHPLVTGSPSAPTNLHVE